ncbi:extracellular tyrosine-protein kinase PKDCC-like [Amphiura filiformis]|uniref:extracellular tyrosine-protein kinase PKDCC-like n=1 Tax=Amphiura filiformis TaxID=82378 RepID=UPI003B21EBFA
MARVWCAVLRWSSRGLRLQATGVLCLTFLMVLTTNIYLVNRTVFDININQSNVNDRFVQDDKVSEERISDSENILLKKLKSLKDELKRTRSRIYTQKQLVTENRTQYKRDLAQNPLENKLKRHLMNADGLDQSLVTMTTTSLQQRQVEFRDINQALYENIHFHPNSSFISCQDLPKNTNLLEHVGAGYTKQVKKIMIDDKVVALKQANRKGHDGKECVQFGMNAPDCLKLANYKVLKELALLQQLESPHIIKLLGYCVKDEKKEEETPSVTIATEFGVPLTFITLLQMSWEDRLRIALGVTRLLYYLHNSPIGALTIHDFKLTQFVLFNNEIKLADLDDVEDTQPTCIRDEDCVIGNMIPVPCMIGQCQHYSDRLNVFHAHKLFYSLLPFEAPVPVQKMISELTNNTGQSTWSSRRILQTLDQILDVYRNSSIYGNIGGARHIKDMVKFDKFPNQDYPAVHDYWCHGTIYAGANSCAFSVVDESEARYLCSHDPQCKAFVMTSQKTWTGRTVIYLKSQTSEPVQSDGNTLYIRVT